MPRKHFNKNGGGNKSKRGGRSQSDYRRNAELNRRFVCL